MTKWQRVKFQPNLPLGTNGDRVTNSKAHRELSKNVAKEGMVLVKNDSKLLPFARGTKVALFGKASIDYVKGGGGSGDVTVSYTTNLHEGMTHLQEHVSVFEPLSDFYKAYIDQEYKAGKAPGLTSEPKLPATLLKDAASYTDTAVISICRFSGEGWDRPLQAGKEIHAEPWVEKQAQQSSVLFENGDFCLSNNELVMVEAVKATFSKVIVVMNVGGVVDTQWFVDDDRIHSVLMNWQGGMEGGLATAELLCGIGNPSGKLVDTFAKTLADYPSSSNFHESKSYVDYTEDIYVGYRFFETIPGASEKVNYPFGYGLSYTEFEWDIVAATTNDKSVTIKVDVINTGDRSGKEVLQTYAMPPQGKLGKPSKNLVAFKKTRLLKPGERQRLLLEFDIAAMASYDDLGKIQKSAYILEKGNYGCFVGTSIRDGHTIDCIHTEKTDRVTEQLSEKLAPTALQKRLLADGSYETLNQLEGNDFEYSVIGKLPPDQVDGFGPQTRARERYSHANEGTKTSLIDVVEGKVSMDDFVALPSDDELAHLLGGQPNVGVANTWGFGNLPEYGIPSIMTADGPAGLRINKECGVNTTAWPCTTLLACTWDDEAVFSVGVAGAKEVKENNIAVWLTPAVNIHRSPLCGRNFEYYSEDPFLTGTLATAMAKGIQSMGISCSVKHFALNNKETNRRDSDSRVSERAAREIYLKAFEMIVKAADPWCIMTAYNIVNGHRSSENKDLLDGVLRNEWGFKGMVTTDWWTYGEHYKEVKAGNDMKMACGWPERLMLAKEAGALSRDEMEISVKRILELICKID